MEFSQDDTLVQVVEYLKGSLRYEAPTDSIHSFSGGFFTTKSHYESLSIDNFLPADSVVTDGPVVALVVYIGDETRIAMSRTKVRPVRSGFDSSLNRISKTLFLFLSTISFILTAAQNGLMSLSFMTMPTMWYSTSIHFLRFFLLLSSILPISIRVNLDFSKIVYSYLISSDVAMDKKASLRCSSVVESIGEVNLIMSDKTGTLTNNDMRLRRLIVRIPDQHRNGKEGVLALGSSDEGIPLEELVSFDHGRFAALLVIALCNNVHPIILSDESHLNSSSDSPLSPDRIYDGGSPDEIALVEALAAMGLYLLKNDGEEIWIRANEMTIGGDCHSSILIQFKRILEIPFSSQTKAMVIIGRLDSIFESSGRSIDIPSGSGRYFIALKGADEIILPQCQDQIWGIKEADGLAKLGLRSMALAHVVLSNAQWDNAHLDLKSFRDLPVQNQLDSLLQLFGPWQSLAISGVEDDLQDHCAQTISAFYEAGVKVWMVTGDKAHTALAVGRTSGIISPTSTIIILPSDLSHSRQVDAFIEDSMHMAKESNINNCVLILDSFVYNRAIFLERHAPIFLEMRSVILSRLSPKDKASLVRFISALKNNQDQKVITTLSIGDGGNDVPMLLEANVGVGIEGRDGTQAALSGDVSIGKFSDLRPLVFWHGRNARNKSARLSSFIIHRGMIFAFIQALYCALFSYVPLPIYQGWLCVGYATVFTMFPVFCLILGNDIDQHTATSEPQHFARSVRKMDATIVFQWMLVSLFQAFVIIVLALVLFDSNLSHLVAITFTSLVSVELLNVISEARQLSAPMLIAQLFSIVVYILAMELLPEYFDTTNLVWTTDFWSKVVVITLLSWLPVHVINALRE